MRHDNRDIAIENIHHSKRPSTSSTDEIVKIIKELILKNHHDNIGVIIEVRSFDLFWYIL